MLKRVVFAVLGIMIVVIICAICRPILLQTDVDVFFPRGLSKRLSIRDSAPGESAEAIIYNVDTRYEHEYKEELSRDTEWHTLPMSEDEYETFILHFFSQAAGLDPIFSALIRENTLTDKETLGYWLYRGDYLNNLRKEEPWRYFGTHEIIVYYTGLHQVLYLYNHD